MPDYHAIDEAKKRFLKEVADYLEKFLKDDVGDQECFIKLSKIAARRAKRMDFWENDGLLLIYSRFEEIIRKLKEKDKDEWAGLLGLAEVHETFNRLKELSPFKDEHILIVDSLFFHRYRGDFPTKLAQVIVYKKRWHIGDDKFLFIFPKEALSETGAFWVGSNRVGAGGPLKRE